MAIIKQSQGALARLQDVEFYGDYGLLSTAAKYLGHKDEPRTLIYGVIWTAIIGFCMAGSAPAAMLLALIATADVFRGEKNEEDQEGSEFVKLPQEVLDRLVPVEPQYTEAAPYAPGPITQLHALPVAATPPTRDDDEGNPQTDWGNGRDKVATKTITALDRLLQAPLANRAFIGAQRTGKSGLVAVAGRRLAARGYTFYHINLASYSDGHSEDDDYTKHIHPANSVRGDIALARSKEEVHRLVDRATSLVHDWFATKNSILIVDEWFSLASQTIDYSDVTYPLAQLIAGKLAHLTSAGTKRGLALWMVTPQVKAGAMTEAGKEIKQAKLCYVGIAPGKSIQWGSNRITWDAELFKYVKSNFPIDPPSSSSIQGESRISFVNGEWLPLGTQQSDFDEMARAPKQMPAVRLHGMDQETDPAEDDIEIDMEAFEELGLIDPPKSIPAKHLDQIIAYLVAVLEQNRSKLPLSQAAIASDDTKLKKIKAKIGGDDWIQFLKYCESEGRISIEKSPKGIKLDLPSNSDQEDWDDIISS